MSTGSRDRRLPPAPAIVVGVSCVPRLIGAAMPRLRARDRAARPLSIAYAHIRLEPTSTLGTRPLLRHSTVTIAGRAPRGGSFLASRPGSFLASSEVEVVLDLDMLGTERVGGDRRGEVEHEQR